MCRGMRITLLEGGRVGALALSAAIHESLRYVDGDSAELIAVRAKSELLDVGNQYVAQKLPPSESEVLYGRAGYLQAIAFVISETNDADFGKALVQKILKDIVAEGENVAVESGSYFPLLWEWHGKAYLGAIHGVAGILFTLLCFYEEVSLIEGAIGKIKATIAKLDELCFASGNLKSSLGSEKE